MMLARATSLCEWTQGTMRRFLIALAAVILAFVAYMLFWEDPFPIFMTDYQLRRGHTYKEAERAFFDFVVKTFPIGSDAKAAIAQITRGGFRVIASGPESVELLWERKAGFCALSNATMLI
jgi:hypothetical protein